MKNENIVWENFCFIDKALSSGLRIKPTETMMHRIDDYFLDISINGNDYDTVGFDNDSININEANTLKIGGFPKTEMSINIIEYIYANEDMTQLFAKLKGIKKAIKYKLDILLLKKEKPFILYDNCDISKLSSPKGIFGPTEVEKKFESIKTLLKCHENYKMVSSEDLIEYHIVWHKEASTFMCEEELCDFVVN